MERDSANHARLGKFEYPLVRAKLREWLVLEELYSHILRAAEEGNKEDFVSSIYSFISAALPVSTEELQKCNWSDVTRTFKKIYDINRPTHDFPIFKVRISSVKQKPVKDGWEYIGRDWYMWLHMIAKAYGWSVEYVADLDVDDAIALLQEIMVEHQLDKEWQWSMSEMAYSYNEATKTSRFVPLERPEWMKSIPKEMKRVQVRSSELPVGVVLKWDTDKNVYTKPQ